MTDNKRRQEVAAIRAEYEERTPDRLSELEALDRKIRRPANVFAYAFGAFGALVLGTGMCLAMKVIGSSVPLGIVIGCVGIAMVSADYSIYRCILRAAKKKNAAKILSLSDEILKG